MVFVHFNDWRKNLTKKDKQQKHEMNIFELIFSKKTTELGLTIEGHELINIFCVGNERSPYSFKKQPEIGQIEVKVPYSFQSFFSLESTEAKFEEFKQLIHLYAVPVLLECSPLPKDIILEVVDRSLQQIPAQNYEAVFLGGKIPKKSVVKRRSSRRRISIVL